MTLRLITTIFFIWVLLILTPDRLAQLKLEILSTVDAIEGQTEPKLALIAVALRTTQPADVRQAAIENLTGIDDRRAIATWQTLLNDRDPEVAETAREQILRLQELETP